MTDDYEETLCKRFSDLCGMLGRVFIHVHFTPRRSAQENLNFHTQNEIKCSKLEITSIEEN